MGPILYPGPPNVPGTESTVGYPYIWPAKVQHHQNPWRHRGGFGVPPTVPVSAYPVPTQGPGMGYGSTTPTPILNQGYQPGPGGQYGSTTPTPILNQGYQPGPGGQNPL